jgi:hypothetical protein
MKALRRRNAAAQSQRARAGQEAQVDAKARGIESIRLVRHEGTLSPARWSFTGHVRFPWEAVKRIVP